MIAPVRVLSCLLLGVAASLPSTAPAAVLASQDFEGNTVTPGLDGQGDATADAAVNTSVGVSAPGTVWDSGTGLGWTLALYDPELDGGPLEDTDSGDVIGVVDGSYLFAPNGNGTNHLFGATDATGSWMHADDADEGIEVTFATIDASGYESLELSFTWAVNDTSYEAGDFLDVSVNGTSVFNAAGTNDAMVVPPIKAVGHLNQFSQELVDLSVFDGQMLDVVVTLATTSAAEDIGFDNLLVSGEATIPEPTTLAMLCLAGGLALPLRRHA